MPMMFFGKRWDAPFLDDGTPVRTPVGEDCMYSCGEPIVDGDQGVVTPVIGYDERQQLVSTLRPAHRECFLRDVVGSVAHLEGRCRCPRSGKTGGDEERGELPWREQGRATIAWLEARR